MEQMDKKTKRRARDAVSHAKRAGRLPKASSVMCVACGSPAAEYDHAHGYDEANWLNVEAVCRPCHNLRKVERGEMAKGDRVPPENRARGDRNGARLHPERLARGDRNGTRLHPERAPRGTRHGMSKLDESRVRGMRALRSVGVSAADIASWYGVAKSTAEAVLTRAAWRHVH